MPHRLTVSFYARPARIVARELLGKLLVRDLAGVRLSGVIVETEAYCDSEEADLACHGARNDGKPTARNAVMFGAPGCAYVYFTYGMHWMLNIVTGEAGRANAVLLRALEPQEGIAEMSARRSGRQRRELTNGPAKLAQALEVTGAHNGLNLCDIRGCLWVEEHSPTDTFAVAAGPRIGLGNTPEPWLSIPWRFWIRDNPYVSR